MLQQELQAAQSLSLSLCLSLSFSLSRHMLLIGSDNKPAWKSIQTGLCDPHGQALYTFRYQ